MLTAANASRIARIRTLLLATLGLRELLVYLSAMRGPERLAHFAESATRLLEAQRAALEIDANEAHAVSVQAARRAVERQVF